MSEKRYPNRMHEVLGVEANEDFIVSFPGDGEYQQADFECFVDDGGNFKYKKYPELPPSIHIINYAINHGITRRPRLTEEQREQLGAIWTLGGRWLAKNCDGGVNYYTKIPYKEVGYWVDNCDDDKRYGYAIPLSAGVCGLQELNRVDEPYDIGKALGWKDEKIRTDIS